MKRLICLLNGHRWNPLAKADCLRCHYTNVPLVTLDLIRSFLIPPLTEAMKRSEESRTRAFETLAYQRRMVEATEGLLNAVTKLITSYESEAFSNKPKGPLEVVRTLSPEMQELLDMARENPIFAERMPPELREMLEREQAEA